jgi:hypothetical protein
MKIVLTVLFGILLMAVSLLAAEEPTAEPASPEIKVEQQTPGDSSETPGEQKEKVIRLHPGEVPGNLDLNKVISQENDAEIAKHAMSSPVAIIGVFIPIVAIIMSIGLVVIIVALEYKRRRQQNDIIRAAVEKGLEPPVFPEKKKDPIRTGIIMAAFGLGIGLALAFVSDEPQTGALGLVLLLPGIGYLIYGLIKRNDHNGNGQ